MQSTERKRMTAEERELFAALFALDNILDKFSGGYQRLCQRVPGGWRDYRIAQSRMASVITRLLDTVPVEQLLTVKRQLDLTEIRIGIKSAAGRDKNYWVMSYDDLADLAEYATKTECFTCDGAKHNCRLRQILKELPIQGVSKLIVNCWREE